jgi:hypothetical protein
VIHGNRVITLKDEVQLAISGSAIFFDQLANQIEESWVLAPLEAVLRRRPRTADERASSPFAVSRAGLAALAPLRGGGQRSPFFSIQIFESVDIHCLVRDDPLEWPGPSFVDTMIGLSTRPGRMVPHGRTTAEVPA